MSDEDNDEDSSEEEKSSDSYSERDTKTLARQSFRIKQESTPQKNQSKRREPPKIIEKITPKKYNTNKDFQYKERNTLGFS